MGGFRVRNSDHKKYCSMYVQLSRLQSSDRLHLLQKIDMEDLRFCPDDELLVEMERLEALERQTISSSNPSCFGSIFTTTLITLSVLSKPPCILLQSSIPSKRTMSKLQIIWVSYRTTQRITRTKLLSSLVLNIILLLSKPDSCQQN
jgi:hypothetical protein